MGIAVCAPVSSRHTHVPLRLPNCMHPHVLFLCAWQLLVEIKKNLRYPDSPPAMALAVSGALTTMLSSPTPCISNADCSSGLTCVDLAGPQVCEGELCDFNALSQGSLQAALAACGPCDPYVQWSFVHWCFISGVCCIPHRLYVLSCFVPHSRSSTTWHLAPALTDV